MKLSEVCIGITDGSHNPPSGIEKSEYLMLSSKNIFDDELTFNDPRYLSEDEYEKENKRTSVKSGDVLLTIVGTVGRSLVVPGGVNNITLQRSVAVLHPNYEKCRSRYLMYLLQSKRSYFENEARGVAGIEIDLCSFEKQDKIVELLDKAKGVILARHQQLEQLDLLIKSRFVEIFGDPISNPKGWNMVELGELTGIGSSKRIFEKEYVSEGIPFYRTKEIVELSKGHSISTELYIAEERFAEIKEQYGVPKAGDLLISAVGTIGVIWIVDGKNDFYFKDGNLIRVGGSEKFDSVYMKKLLEHLIAEYKKQMSSGTAYAALTISGLTKMKVYDAPINLQNQFADFVKQVNKSKVAVQKSLDEVQLLFDSLMQKYFG